MRVLLLGYGKEGKAGEEYFRWKFGEGVEFDILENMSYEEMKGQDYSGYDIILRSPSVRPLGLPAETSLTRYFFDNCPCPIIGVTATKGKGTTCSFVKSLLDAQGFDAYLVGNIGVPAVEVLDKLTEKSVVVYEMSSFQLWDVDKSPHVAVLGVLEPDHLNVHSSYEEYLGAKANITKFQGAEDYLVYNASNAEAVRIAEGSKAVKVAYPFDIPEEIREAVKIPGEHNVQNAIAGIGAVASYLNISPDEYLREHKSEVIAGLSGFKGLPHRLEFVREIRGVRYYDDNFATNVASMKVALEAFPEDNLVVIAGGRDKTENEDLAEIYEELSRGNVRRVVLIGESGHEIARRFEDSRFVVAGSLEEAVRLASSEAEKLEKAVVLMSPAAASFDMFKDVYDRGAQYQELVRGL